jgi:transaldolase
LFSLCDKPSQMANALEKLKEFTVVVADTGDFEQLAKYKPQDSTTNPTLVYTASQQPQYRHLLEDAVKFAKERGKTIDEQVDLATDKLFVNFGVEILSIVPGRVSTEIDARLSFDTETTIKKAREIIALYKEAGIDKERVLVKVASTWEGIQAAKQLEQEGIHCNLTLLFSLVQAAACAEAGVTLISPFAGRITDFFKQKEGKDFPPTQDPGVLSVKTIFNYYKQHGYKTVVMGASFRTKEQIIELAGCDYLTISPKLLEDLRQAPSDLVAQKLDVAKPEKVREKWVPSQKEFLWELTADEMAHFKTAEGIRKFAEDLGKLQATLKNELSKGKN